MKRYGLEALVALLLLFPSVSYAKWYDDLACIASFGVEVKYCKNVHSFINGLADEDVIKETFKRWFLSDPKAKWNRWVKWITNHKNDRLLHDTYLLVAPDEMRFKFTFMGSGFQIIYESDDKLDIILEMMEKYHGKPPFYEILRAVTPDELRIIAGGEFALLITVDVEATIIYETEEKIEDTVKIVLENMK